LPARAPTPRRAWPPPLTISPPPGQVYAVICGTAALTMLVGGGGRAGAQSGSGHSTGRRRPSLSRPAARPARCPLPPTLAQGSVVVGRSFAMDFFRDWYPREFWGTPLVKRLTSHLAWVWIVSQLIMTGAALVGYQGCRGDAGGGAGARGGLRERQRCLTPGLAPRGKDPPPTHPLPHPASLPRPSPPRPAPGRHRGGILQRGPLQ
jgi:hypothetical protein